MTNAFPFIRFAGAPVIASRPEPRSYRLPVEITARPLPPAPMQVPPPPPLFARSRCVPRGGYQQGLDCRIFAEDAPYNPRAGQAVIPTGTIVEILGGPWWGPLARNDRFGRYAIAGPFVLARWRPVEGGPPIDGWVQSGALFPA
jgi:hypothetical protein